MLETIVESPGPGLSTQSLETLTGSQAHIVGVSTLTMSAYGGWKQWQSMGEGQWGQVDNSY